MNEAVLYDQEEIKKYIPQRDPLLLLDSIHSFESGKTIKSSRLLKPSEPVFEGHFPGNPIYPGVYYIESIAQTGAVLLFKSFEDAQGSNGFLSSVEHTRFRKPCKPGDRVYFEVALVKFKKPFYWFQGKALVNGHVAAEVHLSIALAKGTP